MCVFVIKQICQLSATDNNNWNETESAYKNYLSKIDQWHMTMTRQF